MIGPRLTTVFRSRWRALWWGASILLFAWTVVPSPDADHQTGTAHDPWAKDSPRD
ncbi:hypothetical protein [Novosphingobium sp. B1]|uniref:hypothetical protein n=1 Tax=Novosphingobium sp. B1 TaxID=1938756 RepID=UPI001593DBF4|nr:hypothetical protein [Novosphingobium sp. B1]